MIVRDFLKQRQWALPLLMVAVLLVSTCCSSFLTQPGTIKSEATLEVVTKVVERHDAYLDVMDLKGEESMRLEGATLILGLQEATVKIEWLRGASEALLDRHDGWVSEDMELLEYQRSTALRSTEILRSLWEDSE